MPNTRSNTMPTNADTLIRNAYLITMDDERRVYTDGFVAFTDGRISTVGPMSACNILAKETIDANGSVVMPGFVNTHNHLMQVALRGFNDDRWPVLDLPAAVRVLLHLLYSMAGRMDEERSYLLSRLHALDMIKSGYTATHDEHFTNVRKDSVDGSWRAIEESGMRGFLARCIVNGERVPDEGAETVAEGMPEVERLRNRFSSSRIEVVPGILNFHFLKDPEDMRRIREGADAIGSRLDVDMTDNSRGATLKARGFAGGQVDYYRHYGVMDGSIYAGKAHALQAHEYDILAKHDARLSMVPMLRFFDGYGLPLHHFFARGIVPGIGTDAPLVTDCQSPFEMMRHTILAQNVAVKREKAEGIAPPVEALWATSEKVLEMATRAGSRTLFMDEEAGSLEVGKAADCVIIDLSRAETQPAHANHRLIGLLVWSAAAANVDTVFVEGKKLLEKGRSTIWDEDVVISEAAQALADIAAETGIDSTFSDRRPGKTFRGWTYL
ncbi:MAG: 5-methylthioadenosine/S-adenosylhomocysteine deaminase [Halieaceae bacterium]|jgi:5-methylthioadenosine/S-adenosylhomocysteine deaminase